MMRLRLFFQNGVIPTCFLLQFLYLCCGSRVFRIKALQILSPRRVGMQRQSSARNMHINPFSNLHQIYPESMVRRRVPSINMACETKNGGYDMESNVTKQFDSELIKRLDYEEYIDDDTYDDHDNNNKQNEPICRVVATSDAKIPSLAAYSSLSGSSKTLVQQLELLYAAQSKKKLRDLTYLPSLLCSDDETLDHQARDQKLILTLKQSLDNGGFRLMDQRDFDLCSALNAGYLLRLSLLPDLKDLDPTIGEQFYPELCLEGDKNGNKKSGKTSNGKLLLDGRVLMFRRGYSQEVTTGRLLLPKLDYLQASLVQRSSASLTRKLGILEQELEDFISGTTNNIYNRIKRSWLHFLLQIQSFVLDNCQSSGLLNNVFVSDIVSKTEFFQIDFAATIKACKGDTSVESRPYNRPQNEFRTRGNKIFRLGRYGVGERYNTFNIIAQALDLSDVLSPFSLCEVGSNNTSSIEQDMYEGIDAGKLKCQYDEIYGKNMSDQPVTVRLLERISIQNTVNFFSKTGRRNLIKNYFKESTLKEPAYEEVIVIWRPTQSTETLKKQLSRFATFPNWVYDTAKMFNMEYKLPKREFPGQKRNEAPVPLEIRAFSDVPMANIGAVLPKTKLVFRPADAFVFDAISIISALALLASLKFDNPRLDLIAVVSLSLFAIRTFFRYSNKYARYDLLVNKFLTKKLVHRGSGALNYIVSQADSQRALRLGLIRDWICENEVCMSGENSTNVTLDHDVLELGKSFVNNKASTNDTRIEIDILSTIDEFISLGLLDIIEAGCSLRFKIKDDEFTKGRIQQLWNDILTM